MGALTIKPYAFQYRPWEMERVLIPNLISVFPETLSVQFKNKKVLRVLNPSNFIGLTNRVRFSEKFFQSLFLQKSISLQQDIDFSFFFNCSGILNLSCFTSSCADYSFKFKYSLIGLFLLCLDFKLFSLIDYRIILRPRFYANIVELVEHFARKLLLSKGFYNFTNINPFITIPKTFEVVSTQTQLSNINVFTSLDLRVYFVDFLLQLKKQNLKQEQVKRYSTNIFYLTKLKHNLYSKSSFIFENQISILPSVNNGFCSQIFVRSFLLEPSTYFFGNFGYSAFKHSNLDVPLLKTLNWFGFPEQLQPNNVNTTKIYVQEFFLINSNPFFLSVFGRCISVFWLKN